MRKIISGLSVLAIIAGIVLGTTGAYFSDVESSQNNTITAGTLELTVNDYDTPVGALVTIDNLKPGGAAESNPITLHLTGNPGRLYKRILTAECQTGEVTEPECTDQGGTWAYDGGEGHCDWGEATDNNDLTSYIWFGLKVNDEPPLIPDEELTMAELLDKWISLGSYEASSSIALVQSFHLKPEVGNWAQGDICSFEEEFMVLQEEAPLPSPCYNCIE